MRDGCQGNVCEEAKLGSMGMKVWKCGGFFCLVCVRSPQRSAQLIRQNRGAQLSFRCLSFPTPPNGRNFAISICAITILSWVNFR